MTRELAVLGLTVLTVAVTVWQHVAHRRLAERARDPSAGGPYRFTAFLGVFLPLVALLTALQLYVEERRVSHLALAGIAALALRVALLTVCGSSGGRGHGPGRSQVVVPTARTPV